MNIKCVIEKQQAEEGSKMVEFLQVQENDFLAVDSIVRVFQSRQNDNWYAVTMNGETVQQIYIDGQYLPSVLTFAHGDKFVMQLPAPTSRQLIADAALALKALAYSLQRPEPARPLLELAAVLEEAAKGEVKSL